MFWKFFKINFLKFLKQHIHNEISEIENLEQNFLKFIFLNKIFVAYKMCFENFKNKAHKMPYKIHFFFKISDMKYVFKKNV